ncbi:hypothetical protein [Dendronalium sp. ChiSLP03b]|uniref:hypothetical protein n=1 Tax=Dendronalium sp. ChiSLP03b TaxID=3075381 RepID=UPI0026D63E29|nr:hypothetical protein [Dendronalium sp. ChiSLP03b]MDZ8205476.1 hypothetical protein [Dendronalium sp. ChiSLP03b]
MTTTQTNSTTQDKKSAKKRQQSFPAMNIGTPKAPLRKPNKTKQEHELLSDWDHAS